MIPKVVLRLVFNPFQIINLMNTLSYIWHAFVSRKLTVETKEVEAKEKVEVVHDRVMPGSFSNQLYVLLPSMTLH